MSPKLCNGEYIVLCTLPCSVLPPDPGEWLAFNHPVYGPLVKEVVEVNYNRDIFFARGVNSLSISTLQMGEIPQGCITGRVVFIIRPFSAFFSHAVLAFKNKFRISTDAKYRE